MEEHKLEEQKQEEKIEQGKNWFDKYYKILMLIPIVIVILALAYLFIFYQNHNDLILRDVSLSGGTTITLTGSMDFNDIEAKLREKLQDVSFRKLTNIKTGEVIALTVESPKDPESLKLEIEDILGYELTEDNSSIEFSGPSLSRNFYRQLILALIISFILMSFVIFILFRTFVPSIAVIFAAFSDIVMPLAVINYLGIKLSAAGIAAFLMLIGYSVDTDILLTTKAIKSSDGKLNSRIFQAFKTGIFMTSTALLAVLPAFFIVTGLPDSFRQIFLILAIGLFADIINTWMTNIGIIKWYCVKKGIE